MIEAYLFDTETNDRDNPEIIEAALMPVGFGSPTIAGDISVKRYCPSRPITLGAMSTHHITPEMLVGLDPSAMFEMPESRYVIAQNVDFDMTAAGAMHSGAKRIDTCAMARDLWPDLDCYSQAALIYHLDRKNARQRLKEAHGAAADILLCKTILDAEIAMSGCDSWDALWRYSEAARIPKKMPFGKHAGTPIGDLPADYRHWLLHKCNNPPIDDYLRIALGAQPRDLMLFCPATQ